MKTSDEELAAWLKVCEAADNGHRPAASNPEDSTPGVEWPFSYEGYPEAVFCGSVPSHEIAAHYAESYPARVANLIREFQHVKSLYDGRPEVFHQHLKERAMELEPDYPYTEKSDPFDWLWALTSSLEGTRLANDDVHKLWAEAKAENERLRKFLHYGPGPNKPWCCHCLDYCDLGHEHVSREEHERRWKENAEMNREQQRLVDDMAEANVWRAAADVARIEADAAPLAGECEYAYRKACQFLEKMFADKAKTLFEGATKSP